VSGKFAELIFNVDELLSADWEDRKVKKVVAPAGVGNKDVCDTVSCSQRHIIPLAHLSAAGDTLTPMLITTNLIRDYFFELRFMSE
jgi:hypothetical protein